MPFEREHALGGAGRDVTGDYRLCYVQESGSQGISAGPDPNRCPSRRQCEFALGAGGVVFVLIVPGMNHTVFPEYNFVVYFQMVMGLTL